jgi:Fis family transcriptional regulator
LPEHFPKFYLGPIAENPRSRLEEAVRQWLEEQMRTGSSQPPANLHPELLNCMEPILLDEVMRRVHGNRWVAAQWLGLNRATVRKKLGKYNLTEAHRPGLGTGERGAGPS